MTKRKLILIWFMVTLLTACGDIHDNYNKYEKSITNSQNESKKYAGIHVDDFYDYENIRFDQAYKMPDRYYILYFYNYGDTFIEQQFKEIIEKYKSQEGSFPVYLIGGDLAPRLEFISKKGKESHVENEWYNPSDVREMPYKGE